MSTKIYTGFRFETNDLYKIHCEMMKLRAEIKPLVEAKVRKYLASRAVDVLDQWTFFGQPEDKQEHSPLREAYFELLDRQNRVKKNRERSPAADFSLDISIIPMRGRVLGMHFTEQRDFVELLEKKPWFSDYSYWDNTDRPEGINSSQWRQRIKVWDRALPGNQPPSACGFTAEISPVVTAFPGQEDVLEFAPPLEKRAKRIVETLSFRHFLKEKGIPADDHRAIMRQLSAWIDWRQSPAGQIWESSCTDQVQPRLDQELTFDLLCGRKEFTILTPAAPPEEPEEVKE